MWWGSLSHMPTKQKNQNQISLGNTCIWLYLFYNMYGQKYSDQPAHQCNLIRASKASRYKHWQLHNTEKTNRLFYVYIGWRIPKTGFVMTWFVEFYSSTFSFFLVSNQQSLVNGSTNTDHDSLTPKTVYIDMNETFSLLHRV